MLLRYQRVMMGLFCLLICCVVGICNACYLLCVVLELKTCVQDYDDEDEGESDDEGDDDDDDDDEEDDEDSDDVSGMCTVQGGKHP